MKRKTALFIVLTILLVMGVAPAAAQVILPPPCPEWNCGGVFTDPTWLKIDYHRVNVDIENQIATTHVDFQFTNEGDGLVEGTFVFPLPQGATVDELVMWVDGVDIEARVLPAGEARAIYDEIVRQYRDPALLEYINQGAIQANVFPIPPGDSRRIEISYSQVLEIDNGLIHYVYPMHSAANLGRVIQQMSISVNVESNDPISNIYSPSHNIAVSRGRDDRSFRAGYEQSFISPTDDFSLFYGIANESINVNLLTYRESATEDGFFMLLVQPPVKIPETQVIPKDVIIVLDQSGSMQGTKWEQAQEAAAYVLENLNPEDRFNVVLFSTGARVYSTEMEPTRFADDAADWIYGMYAEGGTDINLALTTALDMSHIERSTTVIFMTDGVATEGTIETDDILANLNQMTQDNVRIFTFGVGDDVDTILLDSIVNDFRGTSSYVRPTERIDEEVAGLYNKISAPVLTNIELDFGGARVDWLYPSQFPDLFAGEQLTLIGRYRDQVDPLTITLSGEINGAAQHYIYDDLELRGRAGGEPFLARLWATRRIGDLLNSIRLNGENPELVDSIVSLSVRYGIITPYTSFLIEEDDILSQQGRERAVTTFSEEAESLAQDAVGAAAVDAADDISGMRDANAAPAPMTAPAGEAGGGGYHYDGDDKGEGATVNPIQTVGGKTFIMQDGVWTDTTFEPDVMTTEKVVFLSDDYFNLMDEIPAIAEYLALGDSVIIVIEGVAYEVVPE
jgi:Ca-activated chloride channel homolog